MGPLQKSLNNTEMPKWLQKNKQTTFLVLKKYLDAEKLKLCGGFAVLQHKTTLSSASGKKLFTFSVGARSSIDRST